MRVLVVGTNRPCHYRLHDRKHELVLFITHSRATPEDATGPYVHTVVLDDKTSDDVWISIARILHAESPFDAVVSYIDRMQPLAHAIAANIGVACTIDMKVVRAVADKSAMRQVLDQHGIPSCRHIAARGMTAVRDAIGVVGFPCIVKPVDGEASAGVSRIDSCEQIETALAWVGTENIERGVIVEEFLVGDEYSVEAISDDSRHHVIALTKKFKDKDTFVEIGHLVPAPLDPADRDAIEQYVVRILSAFNFRNCPSHTELILTANGPRIVETHTRVGGDRITDLVRHATGVDICDLVAQQSVGVDVGPLLPAPIVAGQSAAIWYADPSGLPTQQLSAVHGVDEVKKLPYIKLVQVLHKLGTPGVQMRSSFDRSGLAVAVGDSPTEALSRAREAIAALAFTYTWKPHPAATSM